MSCCEAISEMCHATKRTEADLAGDSVADFDEVVVRTIRILYDDFVMEGIVR
jgi:hypothetical protein